MRTIAKVLIALALAVALHGAAGAQLAPKSAPPKPKAKPDETFFKGKLLAETQEILSETALQDAINQLWAQGDKQGHEGEYDHFINVCRILMLSNPHFLEPFETTAYLLWSTDRLLEGMEILKRGLAANPDTYYFYDELGGYMMRAKDYAKAIPWYEQAIKKSDCTYVSYNMLATCYEKTNQLDKAYAILEKAAAFPDNKPGQRRLRQMELMRQRKG